MLMVLYPLPFPNTEMSTYLNVNKHVYKVCHDSFCQGCIYLVLMFKIFVIVLLFFLLLSLTRNSNTNA